MFYLRIIVIFVAVSSCAKEEPTSSPASAPTQVQSANKQTTDGKAVEKESSLVRIQDVLRYRGGYETTEIVKEHKILFVNLSQQNSQIRWNLSHLGDGTMQVLFRSQADHTIGYVVGNWIILIGELSPNKNFIEVFSLDLGDLELKDSMRDFPNLEFVGGSLTHDHLKIYPNTQYDVSPIGELSASSPAL